MNKTLLAAIFAAGATLTVSAQGKLDLPGSQLLQDMQIARQAALSRSGDVKAIEPEYSADSKVLVLVVLDGATADDLRGQGIEVVDDRADMVLARLSVDEIEMLESADYVRSMSVGTKVDPTMNVARDNANVTALHNGTDGLDGAKYTGAGVITGLMDTGFDPNHINFRQDGELRVKRLWTITGDNSAVTTYDTPKKIAEFTTDKSKETHGTHVLGIMSGSYNGKGKYAFVNTRGLNQIKQSDYIPYYGVAYESDIAVCCGTTERNNLLLAASNIAAYAKEVGKPAVMNFSLGNTIGAHDGKDASSRYLAELGKEIIICLSAGNEGDEPISYVKNFTANDKSVKSFVGLDPTISGGIDLWSSDSKMLKVTFMAIDKNTGAVKYSYTLDRNTQGVSTYITGNYYNAPGYLHDAAFNSAFGEKGAVSINSNINADNNRYNVYMNLSLNGSANGTVIPAIMVEGEAGSTVYMYSTGSARYYSNGMADFIDGNPYGSISGLACGDNILTVGSYTNCDYWGSFSGKLHYQGYPQTGAISSFSSYGKTFDGRQLPHIVGPGEGVVSSVSTYAFDAGVVDDLSRMSAQVTETDPSLKRENYWYAMSGTSMSSPYVAGVMALWLQADPTLKIDDVKKILQETADHDEFTAVAPERWGYGKINALAGIKKVLNLAGVAGVAADNDDMIVSSLGGNSYEVFAAGANGVSADLYSMSGMQVASYSDNGDNLVVNTDGLASGVYVMKATANGKSLSKKIVVK